MGWPERALSRRRASAVLGWPLLRVGSDAPIARRLWQDALGPSVSCLAAAAASVRYTGQRPPPTHCSVCHPTPSLPCRIASFKDLSLEALRSVGGTAAAGPGTQRGGSSRPLEPLLRELHSDESGGGLGTAAAPSVQAASSGGTPAACSSGSSGGGFRRPPFEQRAEELHALASRWGCLQQPGVRFGALRQQPLGLGLQACGRPGRRQCYMPECLL